MKKLLFLTNLTILFLSFSCISAQEIRVTCEIGLITTDMQEKPLADTKIVIVGSDGSLLKTCFTDKNGRCFTNVSVQADPRYSYNEKSELEPRGTVTVIAFKKGYRQVVLFETGSSFQNLYMNPLVKGQRNEPEVRLANIHHLETSALVQKYADMVNETVND